MGYTVTDFEPTPNPNARKANLDRPICDATRSYFRAEQAADDPVASALFAIEGVAGVMLLGGFVTITKTPDADWPAIQQHVAEVLATAP